jgi:NTP pyrophosphatase (non-canonical NTP hydrolase)
MTFDEYQKKTQQTAIYPAFGGQRWIYPALGLSGESGEVADKLKKVIRDHNGEVTEDTRQAVKKELGDVLWYVSQLARELGFGLDEIAQQNIKKLADRKKQGKLKGSGDNR